MQADELHEATEASGAVPGPTAQALDPVLEVFKRGIDFTLVEKNLRLSTEQLVNATRFLSRFRPLVTKSDHRIMVTDFEKALATLTTSFGDLDLLGEATGGGAYEDLLPHSCEVSGFGVRFRLLNLDKLIVLKRAAGRPKDLAVVAELQGILEKRKDPPSH